MWIRIVVASILSGLIMGFFCGFRYKTHSGLSAESNQGASAGVAFGNWVRLLRSNFFNMFPGWKMVLIRFFGLFLGMFAPVYIFFFIPIVSCRLTEVGFVVYLVLGMGFLKATDLL